LKTKASAGESFHYFLLGIKDDAKQANEEKAILLTVYVPNREHWEDDWKTRRRKRK